MQKRLPIKNWLSNKWVVGPMGCRTNGLSDQWAVGILGRNRPRISQEKAGVHFYHTLVAIGTEWGPNTNRS